MNIPATTIQEQLSIFKNRLEGFAIVDCIAIAKTALLL